eukprot:7002873-Ditylum_brightwellii.AAC.1
MHRGRSKERKPSALTSIEMRKCPLWHCASYAIVLRHDNESKLRALWGSANFRFNSLQSVCDCSTEICI